MDNSRLEKTWKLSAPTDKSKNFHAFFRVRLCLQRSIFIYFFKFANMFDYSIFQIVCQCFAG
jgi:hypothetical protein